MKVEVGNPLRQSRIRAGLAWMWSTTAVGVHLCGSSVAMGFLDLAMLGLASVAAFAWLGAFDLSGMGLRWRPAQSWGYWVKAALVIGGVMVILSAAALITARLVGRPFPRATFDCSRENVARFLVSACVLAPITEEVLYRFVLLTPAAVLFGGPATVALSGIVFAILHLAYGNPGPVNVVAGLVLGWAYLRSGTLLVPILLHALGNLVVLAVNCLDVLTGL